VVMSDSDPIWAAVIVAAGSGSRFGGPVPKQFTYLAGARVIDHSVKAFRGLVSLIVAVVPPEVSWEHSEDVYTVPGGERRQDSVISGVQKAMDMGATHVLVHDGARPLVDSELIERVMRSTESTGTGLPCIPVRDTVKKTRNGKVLETVDRSCLELAQTPQGFNASLLMEALRCAESVTDEASAVEALGAEVTIVPGSRQNIKLTDREDALIIRKLMPGLLRSIGTGLDFHPFLQARPLVFCGCRLAETNGLSGHSDGDVVLHAVADAILAGAREGDIGTLFPPDEDRWKNADSSILLADCVKLVRRKGWKILSLDVTVIGERPRISPHRDLFIDRLADILGAPRESIWIKGTTTNTIGELACGKGVGCHALVELVRIDD